MSSIEKLKAKLRNLRGSQTAPFQDLKTIADHYGIEIFPAKGSHKKFCHPKIKEFAENIKQQYPAWPFITILESNILRIYFRDLLDFIDYLENEDEKK